MYRPRVPTWDDADRAQAATISGLLGAREPSDADDQRFAELIEAVVADEAADGPRLVLADWLTERGNRHGQLITAQLGGNQQRAAGLLRKHRAKILGPFEPFAIKNTIRFERPACARRRIRSRAVRPATSTDFTSD